jgi:hypothetical protein
MTRNFLTFVPAAALLLISAGAAAKDIEVTRFHLSQPLAGRSITLVPAPDVDATSLQYQACAGTIAAELARAGFRLVDAGQPAELTATARIGTQTSTERRRSPFSVGIGGGSAGRNVGVGGGMSFPVGGGSTRTLVQTSLNLQIKLAGDGAVQWEGRAGEIVKPDLVNGSIGRLARAMLIDFPGPSGETVKVKEKQLR